MDYTTLITSEHAQQPKFKAAVAALTQGCNDNITLLQSMATVVTDVDTAVGVQLDTIGIWVGISRRLTVPIAGVFFSFDTADLGFDQGAWLGPYESTSGLTILDDETYRAVLKARIGANYWNGAMDSVNVIGQTALAQQDILCFVLDNMDMTITIYIIGAPSAALLEMIKRGVIPPKPAGVRVDGYILASMAGAPFFALNVYTTTEVAGLDFGSFGAPV